VSEPLDELYLEWLYRQVDSVEEQDPSRTYWSLLRLLFRKEFVWIVPNDDNRVEDGRDLRREFFEEEHIDNVDLDWMQLGCSFLEMLIGLSKRLSFQADGEVNSWFWQLMENLRLEEYTDSPGVQAGRVDEILDCVIWRTYSKNGAGGLFPLKFPHQDQREVEIWFQMHAYLMDTDL
jgi:hypothetical protein